MQIAQTEPTQDDWLPVTAPTITSTEPGRLASDTQISRLVGQVYECAPAAEQKHLLEHLLNPLGALARVSVANGVFARSLFHVGWRDFQVPLNDAPNVHIDHVIDLVDYVQKVRVESIFAMTEMAKAWPVIASSVAWGQLVTGLLQRAKLHRIERDRDDREF
jgi:hypothetical protein